MDTIGGVFSAEWTQRYDNYPQNEVDDRGRIHKFNIRRIVVSVDSASKTNERNDYTAITVWVEDAFRKHYLVDVIRKRMEFPELCEVINDTVHKWNRLVPGTSVSAILVEDKGSGTQYIQTHRSSAPAPVIAIEVGQTSKEFRFDGVLPMFEAGEVLFPRTAGWLPAYEQELLGFPTGSYDDQVDSTSQYLAWARSRKVGGTKKLRGGAAAPNSTPATMHRGRLGSRGRARTGNFSGAEQHTPSAKIGG